MGKLSKYSDIFCFVIRPLGKGYVTKKDQKKLGEIILWSHTKFYTIHFHKKYRKETLNSLMGLKLSKKMLVTEIPEVCWENRFKAKETIEGTGIYATKKMLDSSFVIG